jgi:hypothetical protein
VLGFSACSLQRYCIGHCGCGPVDVDDMLLHSCIRSGIGVRVQGAGLCCVTQVVTHVAKMRCKHGSAAGTNNREYQYVHFGHVLRTVRT